MMAPMNTRRLIGAALAVATWSTHPARAADDSTPAASSAQPTAAAGSFLPWSVSARSPAQGGRGYFTLGGGYDSARGAAVGQASAEAQIWGPLSLRLGGFYSEAATSLRPDAGLKMTLLSQAVHGVDGALAVSYRAEGFNLKPAVEALAAVGRQVGRTNLLANVAFGQGLEEGERYGDVRLAALRRLGSAVYAGLDARGRFDLELEFPEPAGEPEMELQAGPVLTVPIGRLVGATGGFNVGSVF
jgi:hypothetical protein